MSAYCRNTAIRTRILNLQVKRSPDRAAIPTHKFMFQNMYLMSRMHACMSMHPCKTTQKIIHSICQVISPCNMQSFLFSRAQCLVVKIQSFAMSSWIHLRVAHASFFSTIFLQSATKYRSIFMCIFHCSPAPLSPKLYLLTIVCRFHPCPLICIVPIEVQAMLFPHPCWLFCCTLDQETFWGWVKRTVGHNSAKPFPFLPFGRHFQS